MKLTFQKIKVSHSRVAVVATPIADYAINEERGVFSLDIFSHHVHGILPSYRNLQSEQEAIELANALHLKRIAISKNYIDSF